MRNRIKIARITIPKYIRKVKISNKVRPKYWEWDGTTIRSKGRKLLQKYIDPEKKREVVLNDGNVLPQHLKKEYVLVGFYKKKPIERLISVNSVTGSQYVIWDATSKTKVENKEDIIYILCTNIDKSNYQKVKKVIANPTKVDLPNYAIINGQNIYNSTANPFTIGKIFDAIKQMYYDAFKNMDSNKMQNFRGNLLFSYPLQIEVELHDTVKNVFDNTKKGNGRRWDVGNRTDPYMKTFLDFLVCGLRDIEPFIEDDDRLHVTTGNNSYFVPIENSGDRKLVFNIYQDCNLAFKEYLEDEKTNK